MKALKAVGVLILSAATAYLCFMCASRFLLYLVGETDRGVVIERSPLPSSTPTVCLRIKVPSCNRTFKECLPLSEVFASEGESVKIKRLGCKRFTILRSSVPGWLLLFSKDLKALERLVIRANAALYGIATIVFGLFTLLLLVILIAIIKDKG